MGGSGLRFQPLDKLKKEAFFEKKEYGQRKIFAADGK